MQFSHFRVQLHQNYTQKHVNHILHKMLIDISSSVAYSGHLDYVRNRTTTFIRAFNVPAHSQ